MKSKLLQVNHSEQIQRFGNEHSKFKRSSSDLKEESPVNQRRGAADEADFWKAKAEISYVLAVLVFFIHTSAFTNYGNDRTMIADVNGVAKHLTTTMSQVAVPLFFMLSGFVFFREYSNASYLHKMKRRVKSLMIPYLLWNVVGLLFAAFTTLFFAKYFTGREPFELSLNSVIRGVFFYKYNRPFWFIFDLIVFSVFSPLVFALIRHKIGGALSIVAVTVLYCCGIALPSEWLFESESIIFYLVGAYVGCHYFHAVIGATYSKTQIPAAFFGIIVANVWLYQFYGASDDASIWSSACMSILVRVLYCLSLFVVMKTLSLHLPKAKFVNHSFWVYALHGMFGGPVSKLIYLAAPISWMAIPNFCLTISLTLLMIELTARLIHKKSPLTYSLLSGSR